MFQIGDKVVHPMYGAGVVDSIVQKTVDDVARDYYILNFHSRPEQKSRPDSYNIHASAVFSSSSADS